MEGKGAAGGAGAGAGGDKRLEVPHVTQIHSWDCGLACVLMALRYLKKDTDNFKQVCDDQRFGESVWTIDLVQILKAYGVHNQMFTITMGVDKGYSKKSFYKAKFDLDEQRVNRLFQERDSLGLSVENRSVKIEEIIQHVSEDNLVVSLVDWSYLRCKWCDHKCLPSISCVGKCLQAYQGHFIVVCGYNKKDKVIYYRNPSYKEGLCCCSLRNYDSARKSHGTDEDTLFIFKQ